jgi:hypothetical protein
LGVLKKLLPYVDDIGGKAKNAGKVVDEVAPHTKTATSIEAKLATDAKKFNLVRGQNGRFLLVPGPNLAGLVHSRALNAVDQTTPSFFKVNNGKIVSLGSGGADVQHLQAAREALIDTFGAAVYKEAVNPATMRGPPLETRTQLLNANVKEWLKDLKDPDKLSSAQKYSVAKAAGLRGAALSDVAEVRVFESSSKPSVLSVRLETPHPIAATVNLDEIISRIDTSGF